MNIIFFFIILFFIINIINKSKFNKKNINLNLDKYKNESIIYETIDINVIDKIVEIYNLIYTDKEFYKYNYENFKNIINTIEKDFDNKKKVKLINNNEEKIINEFLKDIFEIQYILKLRCNTYYNNINSNKSKILINKIKEINN